MLEVWPRTEVKKKSQLKRGVCEVKVFRSQPCLVCRCLFEGCVYVGLLELLSDVMKRFVSDAPGGV